MKIRLLTCGLFLALALLTSCHPGIVIDLFNNSNQGLAVVTQNGGAEATTNEVKNKRTVRIGISEKLKISYSDGSWCYQPKLPPEQFWERKNSMVSVINLQIETNGFVFVLLPGSRCPETNIPPQPQGFPLIPQS